MKAISQGLPARHKIDSTKAYLPYMMLKVVNRQTNTTDYHKPFTEIMVHELIYSLTQNFDCKGHFKGDK